MYRSMNTLIFHGQLVGKYLKSRPIIDPMGCRHPNQYLLRFGVSSLVVEPTHLSHEKNPYYFPLYWLVNRNPYNGLL